MTRVVLHLTVMRRLPAGSSSLVQGIAQPCHTATERRLAVVMQQLQRLAQDTDSNPITRMEALRMERDRIDAEIESIATGRAKPLEDDRAYERIMEILALADELVGDFRRVRNDFDLLHRQLRERIVQNDSTRGEVLDALFKESISYPIPNQEKLLRHSGDCSWIRNRALRWKMLHRYLLAMF